MLTGDNSFQNSGSSRPQQPDWDETVDVVVVGSGFAGLMAAIQAASLGASVVVLEKRAACGGNSIISDGILVATGCELQQQANIKDSPERLLEDILKAGRYSNQFALAKTLADHTTETCNWLIHDLGVAFRQQVYQFGGHSVARSLTPVKAVGSSIINPMLQKLNTLGVKPRTGWQMTELSLNTSGGVNGVRVIPLSDKNQSHGLSTQ